MHVLARVALATSLLAFAGTPDARAELPPYDTGPGPDVVDDAPPGAEDVGGPQPDVDAYDPPEPECEVDIDCPVDQDEGPVEQPACVLGQCVPTCTVAEECGEVGMCLAGVCAGVGITCDQDWHCPEDAECADGVCQVDPNATAPPLGCPDACSNLFGCSDVVAAQDAPIPPPDICTQLCEYVSDIDWSRVDPAPAPDPDVAACAEATGEGCDVLEDCQPLMDRMATAPVRPFTWEPPPPAVDTEPWADGPMDAGSPRGTPDAGPSPDAASWDVFAGDASGDASGGDLSVGDAFGGDVFFGDNASGGEPSGEAGGGSDDDSGCAGAGAPWSRSLWMLLALLPVALRRRRAW
ncbi:MAG: hypothetical protein ACQEXJ_19690 [Myxococcota bacterium]